MKISFFHKTILLGILSFLPLATWADVVGGNPTYTDDFSTHSFTKPQGVSSMSITHNITVFPSGTLRACPANPTMPIQHSALPALTTDENTCYTCINTYAYNVCDPGFWNDHLTTCGGGLTAACRANPTDSACPQYDPTYSCYDGTNYWCDQSLHTHVGRNCSYKDPSNTWIFRDSLFTGGPEYAKNSACGGNGTNPITGLVVSNTIPAGSYLWDENPPYCVRGGTPGGSSAVTFSDHNFHTDAEIIAMKAAVSTAPTSTDTTLTYEDSYPSSNPTYQLPTSPAPVVYTGAWTNRNVVALGLCADNDSGCEPAGSFKFSGPLHHLQTTFSGTFSDTVNNTFNGDCASTTQKQKLTITRTCVYSVDPSTISGAIHTLSGASWYTALPPDDRNFLSGAMNHPPLATNPAFSSTINYLRNLSMSGDSTGGPSLSMAMGLSPTRHNLLYLFKTGSCNYTSKITDDISVTGVIKPLIDKIKPTIKIEANIGGYHRILVDQENNTSTSNFPFLAGTNGVITLSLVDSGSSNYTSNIFLGWQSFSGVSGMSNYTIKITHIKDYKGDTISPSITPLVDNGFTLSGASYNPNGSITIPHSLTQSGGTSSDAFTVAGTYGIEVAVLDAAGNLSTVDTTFVVHSTSIPSSDPCISPSPPAYCSQVLFCKANPTHPSCLDPTTTPSTTTLLKIDNTRTYTGGAIVSSGSVIYTINGTNTSVVPGPATPTDAYANASDNNLYMIHISDSLGNPVYNWNLYDFQLSGTGIYLDSVNKTGSSAIWVDAGNGYTYGPQTVQTDINGNVFFRLLSYTPGQYTEQFTYKYYQPKIDISNNRVEDTSSLFTSNFPLVSLAQTGQFLHILTGAIDLYTNNRIDLGTSNNVCLDFYTTTSTTTNTLTGFTVSNFLESITSLSPSGTIPSPDFHVTQTGSYLSTISFSSKYPTPSYLSGAVGVFTPEQIGALFTGSLSIETWPYITMTFGDPIQTTKYYITASKSDYGSGIIFGTGRLNRIYIEGLRSTIGKDGYVDAGGSATSSNSADTRNAVHKNVATLIRNRLVGGGIINRVKYLTGNVNSTDLTDITPWDTLIIKGGDLTIGDSSFNVSAATTSLKEIPHKGIIVLQDDNGVGGNIYIKPDVHFIGATLFADESIQSVNDAGALFSKSNSDRTFLLNKQLIIYGGIFSKNTVGGAVRADSNGNYVLPWKNTTSSLDEAVQYDLAFLRMDNLGFNSANSFMSQGHDEYVVILTDPRNLSSPLPGFVVNLQ